MKITDEAVEAAIAAFHERREGHDQWAGPNSMRAALTAALPHLLQGAVRVKIGPQEQNDAEKVSRILGAGVDGQVIVAAIEDGDYDDNPCWLWRNHETNVTGFGRWAKEVGQAPYVRADIAIKGILSALTAALSSAGEKEDAVIVPVEYQIVGEDGEWHAGATSFKEALHYFSVYSQDGPVRMEKVTREAIDLSKDNPPSSGHEPQTIEDYIASPHPTSADKLEVVGIIDRVIERCRNLHDYAGRPAWDDVLRDELRSFISDATRIITACQQEVGRLRGKLFKAEDRHEAEHRSHIRTGEARDKWRERAEAAEKEVERLRGERDRQYDENVNLIVRNAELVKALEEIASDDERGDYEGVVQFARAALRKG